MNNVTNAKNPTFKLKHTELIKYYEKKKKYVQWLKS